MDDINFADMFPISLDPVPDDPDQEPVKSMKKEKPEPMDGLTKYVYIAPTAHRVQDLTRVMDGSIIGYTITRCSSCHGRVDTGGNKDKYCRHCGARLENLYGRP